MGACVQNSPELNRYTLLKGFLVFWKRPVTIFNLVRNVDNVVKLAYAGEIVPEGRGPDKGTGESVS
jgi:hypothetical protein